MSAGLQTRRNAEVQKCGSAQMRKRIADDANPRDTRGLGPQHRNNSWIGVLADSWGFSRSNPDTNLRMERCCNAEMPRSRNAELCLRGNVAIQKFGHAEMRLSGNAEQCTHVGIPNRKMRNAEDRRSRNVQKHENAVIQKCGNFEMLKC